MKKLNRLFGMAVVVCAVGAWGGGCGFVTRDAGQGPPVAEPVTPAQKATADPENPDAAVLADFNARLEKYVKFQRGVADDSPRLKETSNPAEIAAAQELLAAKIRTLRKNAKRGDIFTPQVSALFRRLMYPELKGAEGRETKADIKEEAAEQGSVKFAVNAKYPDSSLPTVPANILAVLPALPKDVEYRIIEQHLILRDVDANIIVDFIPNAIRS